MPVGDLLNWRKIAITLIEGAGSPPTGVNERNGLISAVENSLRSASKSIGIIHAPFAAPNKRDSGRAKGEESS